ncbi:(2Fe-2S)-binding protein [Pigmentiphaga litoralis]|uniref:Carbon-monoxide dehydrogenase small subunit n=1 Tax=Pigmentiphaga litoralis TaxID=516702 RepID=A0A7Y9LPZ5_9BURK|nr:carbon-monoxide dehydrogenase small subunit [Pigmentiphaga litoralis]NYE84856.1 carbon-monoxide dehydrogenase small subunit [Pigmentiphaga litoralis]
MEEFDPAQKRTIMLKVNGTDHQCEVDVRMHLADCLRGELGLTGTHVGCEHGVCGACTVLVDGHSARSCLMLAVQGNGHEISTVEGLADPADPLHPIQQAFHDLHGLQCGYCTPGILMSVAELLADDPDPSEATVRDVLSGHLCRCTGYQNIVAATLRAAHMLKARPDHGHAG